MTDAVAPILTVDVEDWFHICGHASYSDPSTWEGREKRVHVGVERLLEILAPTPSRATFFILGWIARKSPALVRRIADAGHEIGCHGDLHRRVFELTVPEFREDVRRSRDALQEITGRSVTAYRAPEWSMKNSVNPALAVLVEEGFTLDSSLAAAPPVGDAGNPTRPVRLETPAGAIVEVPPLVGTFFSRRALWGGGVCSRLTRESRLVAAIDRSLAAGIPPVLYNHPWEFDDAHPAMSGLSTVQRLVKFAGLRRTEPRLRRLLARYTFAPISSAAVGAAVLVEEEKISAEERREEREPHPGISSKADEKENHRGFSSKGERPGAAA